MPITIRKAGWPLLSIDTPEEEERRRKAIANTEAKAPLIFETELNAKKYRIRGYLYDGEILGTVCEWLYKGEWKRVRNYELIDQLKEQYYEFMRNEAKLND